MLRPFTYYLHDTNDGVAEHIQELAGLVPDEVLTDNIGRPFYEVKFDCELDDVTGTVTIKKVTP